MRRGREVAAALTVLAAVLLTYHLRLERREAEEPVTVRMAKPIQKQNFDIHRATDEALPASGYILFVQEAERCNGAAVIKQIGSNWRLGIAWYDEKTKTLTDIIKRDELVELLGKYVEVDPTGMYGVRRAVEDGVPEMYVGTVAMSAARAWLQLDPESCGVRSGWLVYRELTSDKTTRQKISW